MAETPDPVDVHVGQCIRERRRRAGLSQDKLAQSIGVTFQQVQKYERGANRISASMLARVAQQLHTRIADFFPEQEDDGSFEPTPIDELAATAGGFQLAGFFVAMAPDRRAPLLNVAAVLAGEIPGDVAFAHPTNPGLERPRHVA